MNKDEVIEKISQTTKETRKKMLATRGFYFQIKEFNIVDFDEDDKLTTLLLLYFSYYEKFIKNIYDHLINYLNYLKKYNINYPEEFNYLSFLYDTTSDSGKKSKLRYFKMKQEQKFKDSFNYSKFLSENQKLSNIKHLIEFNMFMLNQNIENLKLNKYLVHVEENLTIEKIFEKLESFYELRNDRIHGSYAQSLSNINEDFFDFFTCAINILSETLIEMLENKF